MKVLVIDNYDSFAYNLVQYLGELGAEVEVVRNDVAGAEELLARGPDRLVISPGPCTPAQAGVSVAAARAFPEAGVPTLGVCLGHQAMAEAFGGRVIRHEPVHGKTATIEHDGRTIFAGLDSPLTVGRYHSLVVDPQLPESLEESARGGQVVMAIRHRELPAEGVQFHPESILTDSGKALLANFLDGARVVPGGGANAQLVRRFYALVQEPGWAQLELLADDVVYRPIAEIADGRECHGREAFRAYMEEFFYGGDWGDVAFAHTSYREHGDKVIARVAMTGQGRASGAEVQGRFFSVSTVRDGRIVELEDFTDRSEALAAAGLSK
jgi:anthranilate synthase/aminodeoxychorismate synthase-like glutamine amidotransferase